MSQMSSIFNGIITLIETQLPAYHRLADAYETETNGILSLEKGYSLGLADGANTERTICNQISTARAFRFVVSKLYASSEIDPLARALEELALYDDAFKVWKELQKVSVLGGVQVSDAKYVTDGGIEYLGDDQKVITIVSAISAEYFE